MLLLMFYVTLVAACFIGESTLSRALLPLLQWTSDRLASDFEVTLDLTRQSSQWLIAAEFQLTEPILRGGQVLPAGVSIRSTTLAGHALQPLLLIFTVAAVASLHRGVSRALLWISALLSVVILQLLDTPFLLLGNVEGLLADATGDPQWRAVVRWADFLENGGRLMLALAVALLCVWIAQRKTFARPLHRTVTLAMFWIIGAGALPHSAAAAISGAASPPAAATNKISPALWQALASGQSRDVLVLFRHPAEATQPRSGDTARSMDDTPASVAAPSQHYAAIKAQARGRLQDAALEWLRDYAALPVALVRVADLAAAARLLALDEVQALMPNLIYRTDLAESLPLVKRPEAAAQGYSGSGRRVVVIDSGVDFTRAAFGSCTAPGVPATCRVVYAADLATDDGVRDASGHGTNVAGIVVGVAPAAQIVALDVFESNGTTTAALVTEAIDWAIANKHTFAITALNLSLSDSGNYTSPCDSSLSNPLKPPLDEARSSGILAVASSGNNGYKSGISNPACTPNVISVGAVYDADVGARTWGNCSDASTAADKVACFSNSASFLSMLAPGAVIVAAGLTSSGTSMAAPHVAGAVAVLRSAAPSANVAEVDALLRTSATWPLDTANGIAKPRLDLQQALAKATANFPVSGIEEDIPFLPMPALAALAATLLVAGVHRRGSRSKKPRL